MSIFKFIKNVFKSETKQIIIPLITQPKPCTIIYQAPAELDEAKNIVTYNHNNNINIENALTLDEKTFFTCLIEKAKQAGLTGYFTAKPHTLHYFDIDYNSKSGCCWLGRICIWKPEITTKYAVIKEGANRASRIFDSETDAKNYVNINKKSKYIIDIRPVHYSRYMDYLIYTPNGEDKLKSIKGENLSLYLSGIDHWITFINSIQKEFIK